MTKLKTRRAFLVEGVQAASLVALGCSDAENSGIEGDGATPSPDAGADASVGCALTRADIEGPFFTPDSPARTSFLEDGVTGTRLLLGGRLLDASCVPIAGAVLDVWQADEAGGYDDVAFRLRGHQIVDADGRYELTTIVPGRYLNGAQYRPAHLHCKVYVQGVMVLTTQLYFEGDPYNEVDPWFSELTMLRTESVADGLRADFDFSVG
jgi:protocatechuate 3,4-dioxygenase beta subunit